METKDINKQEYLLRIKKVTDYIHQNIDQPLSLQKMAGIACFSLFHFHRVFTVLIGETPTEYIKRARIEKAALLLQGEKQLSATEIAGSAVSAACRFSAATLSNISISLSVNFVHWTKHLKDMENQILIFRTSVTKRRDIKLIGSLLARFPQISKWNVDFEDWEKILRIECSNITALEISETLRNNHIFASELE